MLSLDGLDVGLDLTQVILAGIQMTLSLLDQLLLGLSGYQQVVKFAHDMV